MSAGVGGQSLPQNSHLEELGEINPLRKGGLSNIKILKSFPVLYKEALLHLDSDPLVVKFIVL